LRDEDGIIRKSQRVSQRDEPLTVFYERFGIDSAKHRKKAIIQSKFSLLRLDIQPAIFQIPWVTVELQTIYKTW
jgi:hypothetical protein